MTVNAETTPEIIDLRPMLRPQRHAVIFARVDALAPGESFVLINDHDPLGLRYQLEMNEPGAFSFTYLVSGPEEWQVVVTRQEL